MEERNTDLVNVAAMLVIGVITIPIVMNLVIIPCTNLALTGINTWKFNRKIKKGLKDGSIVEIDGGYFELDQIHFMDPPEEA
jgi:hypothetical protein